MCALKNVKEAELMEMAKLKKCVLMGGLKNVKSVKMENAGKFESVKGLKEVVEEEMKRRKEEEKRKMEEEKKKREEAEMKRRKEEERKKREEEIRKRREGEEKKKREEEEKKKRKEREKKRKEEEERKRKEEEMRRREMEERRKKEEEEKKKREEEERKRREEMNAMTKKSVIVWSIRDWNTANCDTRVIDITSNCCNDGALHMIDLSRFVYLKELKVGDDCFGNVDEVRIIGLRQLERVVIGDNCFTKCKNDRPTSMNVKGHFYLKDCEKLRELKMGRYSFSDYSICEIERVSSLEVIEMGQLNEKSANFFYSSLQLKSECP